MKKIAVDFDKINSYREKRKITVKGFCELCEIGRTTLWGWEHGNAFPSEDKVRLMAKVLNVSVSEISDLPPGIELPSSAYNKNVKEEVSSWLNLIYEDASIKDISCMREYLSNIENKLLSGSKIVKAIMQSLQAIFYIKDINSRYVIANEAFLNNVSLNKDYSTIGKTDFDFFPKNEAKENEEEDLNIISSGESITNKEGFIPGSRRKKWGMFFKHPILSSSGQPIGVVAVITDVTDYRISSKKRIALQKAIDHLDDVFVTIGRPSEKAPEEYNCDYMNAAMKNFLAVESDNDVKNFYKIWNNIFADESKYMQKVRSNITNYPAHFLYKAIRPSDNQNVWLSESIYKLEDKIISIVRDVTKDRASEEARIALENGLNLIDDVVWTAVEENGYPRKTFISDAVTKYTGISKQEFYDNPKAFYECLHKDDMPKIIKFIEEKGNIGGTIEYRLINRVTKEIFHIQETIYRNKNQGVGITKNITDRIQNEKTKELLEFYVKGMSNGFAIVNFATQKFEYINEKFAEIFDTSFESLKEMGAGSWFIHHFPYEERIKRLTIQELKNINKTKQVKAVTAQNKEIFISVRTQIKKFNRKLCLILFIEDISGRKADLALLENIKIISETVPSTVILLDYNTDEVIYSNNKFEEIFGYPEDKVLNTEFWLNNIVHPEDRATNEEYVRNNKFPQSRIYRIIKPDGSVHRIINKHIVNESNGRKYRVLTNSLCE